MSTAWLVRPRPHGILRLDQFRSDNFVAIGWPGIGDLTGKSCQDIKTLLAGKPYGLADTPLKYANSAVDIIVNRMNPGDLVLVPHDDDIFFAEICSDYVFDSAADTDLTGYSHQRKVKWLEKTSRENLSKDLRNSLKIGRTAANLGHYYDEIDALAHGKKSPSVGDTEKLTVIYPLRRNFSITIDLPADITKDEANRLSQYLGTLYFSE